MKKRSLDNLAEVFVVIGALNWGFVGLVNLNLVESILRGSPQLVQPVYVVTGLAGLYWLWGRLSMRK